jgi:hypothetical protein
MQVSKEKAESPCPLMHSCAYRHTHWYSYKLDTYHVHTLATRYSTTNVDALQVYTSS